MSANVNFFVFQTAVSFYKRSATGVSKLEKKNGTTNINSVTNQLEK